MIRSELRSFHAVAKHGGFSAASKVLNISQPTLSTQVKALEERYGVDLFIRAGRSVRLTVPGRSLFEITTRLAFAEEEAEDFLNALKGMHAGTLNVAAVGPFHATDMIVAFKAKYPNVDVTVQFGNSQRSIERVQQFEADVGIIAEVRSDPKVETYHYSTHEVVVFVNSDHRFFSRDSISIGELEGEKVIRREIGSTTRNAAENALQQHGVSVDVVLDLGSREGIWKAVEQGLGIGFVADFEFVSHHNLRAIPIHDATIQTTYYLAVLKERAQSRLVRAFCDIAASVPALKAERLNGTA